jgi:hypothetical protein
MYTGTCFVPCKNKEVIHAQIGNILDGNVIVYILSRPLPGKQDLRTRVKTIQEIQSDLLNTS